MQNRGDFLPFVSPSLRLDAAVALLSSRLDPSIFLSCDPENLLILSLCLVSKGLIEMEKM